MPLLGEILRPELQQQAPGDYFGGIAPGWGQQPGVVPPVAPTPGPAGPYPPGSVGAARQAPGGLPGAGQPNMPYTTGGIPGGGGQSAFGPFNPMDDPVAGVYRALLNRGINPDIPTLGV